MSLMIIQNYLLKALKIGVSVAAVPIFTLIGVVFLTLAWLLFFIKTSPQVPVHLDLVFTPSVDGKCISCSIPDLKFPQNSRVRLELSLTWADRPDVSLRHTSPHVLRAEMSLEKAIYFNFFPTFRSPMVRNLRTFLKLPIYILFWRKEDETLRLHTKFLQVKPSEKTAEIEICPALPLYHSSMTVVFEPKGLAKFIHNWPVIWTIAFLLSATAISIFLGVLLSIVPWFIFGGSNVNSELERDKDSELDDDIGLVELFDQDRNISIFTNGAQKIRQRSISRF